MPLILYQPKSKTITVQVSAKKLFDGGSGSSTSSAIVDSNDDVWFCGDNSNTNFGYGGYRSDHFEETLVNNAVTVVSPWCIWADRLYVIDADKNLRVCGSNSSGSYVKNRCAPTILGSTSVIGLPIVLTDVKFVVGGKDQTFALKNDGTLWVIGGTLIGVYTEYTQVASEVEKIVVSEKNVFIIKNDDTLWACGSSGQGQLGVVTTNVLVFTLILNDVMDVAPLYYATLALKTDGTVWGTGWATGLGTGNSTNITSFTQTASDVKKIYSNLDNLSFIIKNDDTLWSCGNGGGANSGLVTANAYSFVQVLDNVKELTISLNPATPNTDVTLAVKYDNTLWGCGGFANGLGLGIANPKIQVFTKISDNVQEVMSLYGYKNVFVRKTDGKVYGSGNNNYYHLGIRADNTIKYSFVETDCANIIKATTTEYGTTVINSSGLVLSVGTDAGTRLGFSDSYSSRTIFRSGITYLGNIASVSMSGTHTAVVKNNGEVWVCGKENYGNLGNGATVDAKFFTKVFENAVSCSASTNNTAVLKNDGTVWICGYNGQGQFGSSTPTTSTTFIQINDSCIDVLSGDNTMVLKSNGDCFASGYNGYGQLGDNTTTNSPAFILLSSNVRGMFKGKWMNLVLKTDDTLWACGYNGYGQFGNGTTTNSKVLVQILDNVKRVSCGEGHIAVIKNDDTLWTCGYNLKGQLGINSLVNSKVFVQVAADVETVSSGATHTMFIKKDGTIWSCGLNAAGQLGIRTLVDSKVFVQVQPLI